MGCSPVGLFTIQSALLLGELLDMIRDGKFDMTSLISHHAPLEDAADMYRHWHDQQNDYTKIVLKPDLAKGAIQSHKEMEHA